MENVEEKNKKDEKSPYQLYQEMGGIINERDYKSAVDRAENTVTLDNKSLILQAKSIAEEAGIALHNSEGTFDQKIILYGLLRTDDNPGVKYHHSQMSDQQLFAEALRMLGDEESLKKLTDAYPNIFNERD